MPDDVVAVPSSSGSRMKVSGRYVITVDRDGPRLREFLAQPGASCFTVVDGVDLREAEPEEMASLVDSTLLRARYQRDLSPGEIGCALSHLRVMRHVSADPELHDDDIAFVAEDDAVLHEDLDVLLQWLMGQPFDIMPLHHGSASRLGVSEPRASLLMEALYPLSPLARTDPSGRFRVGYTSPDAWMLAVGYLVRKRTATRLSRCGLPPQVDRVADDYRVMAEDGLRVCHVRPSLVWESPDQASHITQTGRVLGVAGTTDFDVIGRMEAEAAGRVLLMRKKAWLLGRDLASRPPWRLRHSRTAERARSAWNDAVFRMPARVRRLLRPGSP